MRCSKAKRLIALEYDADLPVRDRNGLQRHLSNCTHCAAYREEMHAVLSGVDKTASSQRNRLSGDFSDRLHTALVQENVRRSDQSAFRIPNLLERVYTALLSPSLRVVRGASAFACLLIIAVCIAAALFSTPSKPRADYSFGHIAAFSIQTRNDGRVYAVLSAHQSTYKINAREGYTK